MDKHAHSSTNFEHLKPLSVYCKDARLVTCENAVLHSPKKASNSFINFKIEILNNCAIKRKLDDSSPDFDYETPVKRPCSPKDLSPDLGCFMDDCSSARQDSPFVISIPSLLDNNIQDKDTVSSQLHLEHVEAEPGVDKGIVPHTVRSEMVLQNLAPAFDWDVDDILCLHPSSPDPDLGYFGHVEEVEPLLNPSMENRQELDRGDGPKEEGQMEKKMYMNVNNNIEDNVEEDKGYFSMSYLNDLKMGKNPSQSICPQMPLVSPLLQIGEAEAPEKESPPESSSEPAHTPAALSGQDISFKVSDLCPVVTGPLLQSDNTPVEHLQGDVEEVWTIGCPILESSVCQVTLGGEDISLNTTYETTLPLQVKVKSVVVAVSQQTSSGKAASSLPEQSAKSNKLSPDENRQSETASSARSQRPSVFDREVDWEREKRLYVHSVTRHMKEHQGANNDCMNELQSLMTHVADQTPGGDGQQWQHPSDFTRRNYQRRLGIQMPKMTLKEWQAKNCTTHKRFAKVPKVFQRSQFP
ncbi:S100P-binding protein-like [Centropristis striata]|uniref:S100P-binding protein-like n=1 Tax=Centropristis striata TaxID=184440 RepID=UPI0027E1A6E6|nr:S100P-binding protein-like [Centropristis striata]XP_059209039.1 S100P-binding protein-like [Centropristis striata]XP_059209040.1 S100P-binding protein-like [Centropristis striata]XP_059209041.1 S100P-binding protein-like [Centropristis striata]